MVCCQIAQLAKVRLNWSLATCTVVEAANTHSTSIAA